METKYLTKEMKDKIESHVLKVVELIRIKKEVEERA